MNVSGGESSEFSMMAPSPTMTEATAPMISNVRAGDEPSPQTGHSVWYSIGTMVSTSVVTTVSPETFTSNDHTFTTTITTRHTETFTTTFTTEVPVPTDSGELVPSQSSSNAKQIAAAVGGTIALILLLLSAVVFFVFRRRRRMQDFSRFLPVVPASLPPAQTDIEKTYPIVGNGVTPLPSSPFAQTSPTFSVTRKPVPRYEPSVNEFDLSTVSTTPTRLSTATTTVSWDPFWANALTQDLPSSVTQGSNTQSSVEGSVYQNGARLTSFSSSQTVDAQSSAGDDPFADSNSPYLTSRFSETQPSDALSSVDEEESDPFVDPPTSPRLSTVEEETRSSTVFIENMQYGTAM